MIQGGQGPGRPERQSRGGGGGVGCCCGEVEGVGSRVDPWSGVTDSPASW